MNQDDVPMRGEVAVVRKSCVFLDLLLSSSVRPTVLPRFSSPLIILNSFHKLATSVSGSVLRFPAIKLLPPSSHFIHFAGQNGKYEEEICCNSYVCQTGWYFYGQNCHFKDKSRLSSSLSLSLSLALTLTLNIKDCLSYICYFIC